jgi:CCR4-NOT transcription complex subunit 1
VKEILSKIDKKITEKDIAECLGCMARTYTNMTGVGSGSPNGSNWGVENFVSVVKETVRSNNNNDDDTKKKCY